MTRPTLPTGRAHLAALTRPLRALGDHADRIEEWARHLAGVLSGGGRLLVAGNGGSAAQAQHLTAELVCRYRDDRRPLSAIALHADTSTCTAIGNDYSAEEVFARQVEAHGRPGDVLVALSTSGRSPNVVRAAERAVACRVTAWALTGPLPNALAGAADDAICIEAPTTATIQEVHLVAMHMLCAGVDVAIGVAAPAPAGPNVDRRGEPGEPLPVHEGLLL